MAKKDGKALVMLSALIGGGVAGSTQAFAVKANLVNPPKSPMAYAATAIGAILARVLPTLVTSYTSGQIYLPDGFWSLIKFLAAIG